ncbi:class A beta-lactamase [Paracoccus methylarcula]|uniref:Beta-lactamase n=1 Tax=Paracoccus methylarcula TaxID=72022 RepID=A0A422QXU4_9RHOB|nr:class A beta-lactamase [Paracoccus methylarcula]RNF34782.1 class A beta-lactamase [Paracoccus methylarcula]
MKTNSIRIAAVALTGLLWLQPASAQDAVTDRVIEAEQKLRARVGYSMLDLTSGETAGYRSDERFPMLSTFKVPLCAAVLARVDAGEEDLDRRITYSSADLVEYSPVTEQHVESGMTLSDLCEAAITMSDNTAANLLLESVGGPEGLTAFLRATGDGISRLDRWETELNEALPDDPRDTTTPQAMVATLDRLLFGGILSESARKTLVTWMENNLVADDLIRASLPQGWYIADKSGAGARGSRAITGVLGPEGRPERIVAIYMTETPASIETRNAEIAAIAKVIVADWNAKE